RDSARMQERLADMTSILQEALYGIRVVKAFAMEHFEIDKFKRQNRIFRDTLTHMARIRNLSPCLTEYVGVIVGVIVLYFGGREVLGTDSSLSPGGFILFLGALFSLMQPLKFLGQVHNSLKEGIVAAQRVFTVLDTPPAIKDNPDAVALERFEDSIRFNNVSFSYNETMEVLQDISLVVKKGQVLALVGPSGGGKSTLIDLLVRFYDPTEGSIEIDGHDIRTLTLTSLRHLMGIVTQETILFNDTIWNNIAYGKLGASEEEVIRAAKAANAHEFISKMPLGYQTVIGDRGVKLSGGQRQRLAIARAILKNPPILIFDEATSSLDTQSELLVQEAIERLLAGRTSFVIAQRLSTVQHADHIVVLNNGKIVQQGVHKELIIQEGLYKQLYEMQFKN
ncbi:MAG: ABC transporter ATP-binding protein/permease, partial [candidate division KSB1 bacterium]|nr:ABC transporter ATP-binding protein/permease [candidate division KSB1 bacterium]